MSYQAPETLGELMRWLKVEEKPEATKRATVTGYVGITGREKLPPKLRSEIEEYLK